MLHYRDTVLQNLCNKMKRQCYPIVYNQSIYISSYNKYNMSEFSSFFKKKNTTLSYIYLFIKINESKPFRQPSTIYSYYTYYNYCIILYLQLLNRTIHLVTN